MCASVASALLSRTVIAARSTRGVAAAAAAVVVSQHLTIILFANGARNVLLCAFFFCVCVCVFVALMSDHNTLCMSVRACVRVCVIGGGVVSYCDECEMCVRACVRATWSVRLCLCESSES